MRYVQLRAFHEVARCGSFSLAAESLNLTQPAISDQVRKLEVSYDIVLFNRQKKRVSLTPPGAALYDVTRRLFVVEREARDLLAENQRDRRGTLRLVVDSAHHLLPVLSTFRAQYPNVTFDIRTGNSQEVVAALHAYQADLGVTGDLSGGAGFATLSLGVSAIVAFASINFPIPTRECKLSALAEQSLVLREKGSKTRRAIEEAGRRNGTMLRPTIQAEGRESVRELVASGAGVGFVSEAEFGNDPRLQKIQITDCEVVMEETLVCLKERSQSRLVASFFDIARGQAASVSGS